MEAWLNERRPKYCENGDITNGEEMSLCRVGSDLYEKIFKHYTKKQWDKYPKDLDASVLARLPVRKNREDRYFNDPFEGLPQNGYTRFFENILLQDSNIDVRLNVDYFKVLLLQLTPKWPIFIIIHIQFHLGQRKITQTQTFDIYGVN